MFSNENLFYKEHLFLRVATKSEKVRKFDKTLKHPRFCMFKFTKFSLFQKPSNGKKNTKNSFKSEYNCRNFLKIYKITYFPMP